MFTLNDDLSIYATRGDIVFFSVCANEDGEPYSFKAGDVVRIKIFGKKAAEDVVLQKDFPITEDTEEVEIFLGKEDTKIGDVISKHKDYWYEIVLNDDTNPQTIIGYDEDGAKIFRLFPEGDDIPPYEPKPEDVRVMDDELDMTSTHPVQNQAIARAFTSLRADFEKTNSLSNETAKALSMERERLDNLIAPDEANSLSQDLEYLGYITEETRSKIDGEIISDGVFATIKVNLREANLFYGGSGMGVFYIPNECRPIDTGLIHTQDDLEYIIDYDATENRYILTLNASADVLTAPSGAGTVTITYALGDYELKDIRVGADGETYNTAGTAIRAQINTLADRSKEMTYCNDLLRLNGYYEPELTFENKYIVSASGHLRESEARALTNFIYCPYGADIDINCNAGYMLSLTGNYDEHGSYLGFGGHFVGMTFRRYVVCKSDNTQPITPEEALANIKVTVSTSRTITNDRANTILKGFAEVTVGKNLLDKSKATLGYIEDKHGRLVAPNNSYFTSDFVPLDGGQAIAISPRIRKFLAYDENFNPIVESFVDAETPNFVWAAGVKGFVRFTYYAADVNVQAEYGTEVTEYTAFETTLKPSVMVPEACIKSVLHNKVGCSFGDSIMYGSGNAGEGILDILNELHGVKMYDYSVGGASVQKLANRKFVGEQIAKAISQGIAPDFILLDGLSNDVAHGTLGEMSGNFNYKTNGYDNFASGLEYCIGTIKENFPLVPLVYIIPHSSAGRNYEKELAFGEMAREICKKWSVPVADIYKDGNMTARIAKQLQAFTYYPEETSGTHPNRAGYDHAYIPIITDLLNKILK